MSELGTNVVFKCLEATRLKPLDVLVKRIDEHPEGQISLELRCRPVEDELPTRVSASRELSEQTGLADPGLTHQRERGGPPTVELGKRGIEHAARLGAPNEVLAYQSHIRSGEHKSGARAERSGCSLDVGPPRRCQPRSMSRFVLHHRHEADDCGVVFASFKGHDSPLRRQPALASCRSGGHAIWWTVEAESEADALALLPFYVAERTTATSVTAVDIP